MKWIRWGPAGIYATLIVCSTLYIIYRIQFAPTNSEFSGMPLILLTLPWSVSLPLTIGGQSVVVGWIGIAVGAIINGSLLWFLGWFLSRAISGLRQR